MNGGYRRALERLYALVPSGIVLGLEPVRAALDHFDNPQSRFRVAHIAGTNGKGSTAAFVAASLARSKRRVGLYTSPHLHRFAERVRCSDGRDASLVEAPEELLGASLTRVLDAAEAGSIPNLTLFEATTVAAWLVFSAMNVEDVVLEVGLGGRLDATNVCDPAVCAITSIGLDHMALLGDTLDKIAREKAGILKKGVSFFLGPQLAAGEARAAIDEVSRPVGARLVETPALDVLEYDDRGCATVRSKEGGWRTSLGLAGAHQVDNARTALGVLRALCVPEDAIAEGLAGARWAARLERIDGAPSVLIDSAHNLDGTRVLLDALSLLLARKPVEQSSRAIVFGASSDKRWRESVELLRAFCQDPARWYFAAANLSRATAPVELAAHRGGVACDSIEEALSRAKASVGPGGLVVVCGSIFVAAAARALLLGEREDPPLGL